MRKEMNKYDNTWKAFGNKKTPWTNPYDYDPFVTFSTGEKANNTIYSDRLFRHDHKKHDELCRKHFGDRGQYWDKREPNKIQDFLRDWCDDNSLKLVTIEQQCNVATGYPLWRFDVVTGEKK